MKPSPQKVLVLAIDPGAAEAGIRELRQRLKTPFVSQQAGSLLELKHALQSQPWDLVLQVEAPKGFSAFDALIISQEYAPATPYEYRLAPSAGSPDAAMTSEFKSGIHPQYALGLKKDRRIAEEDSLQPFSRMLQQIDLNVDEFLASFPAVVYMGAAEQFYSATYVSPQIENMLGYPAEDFMRDKGLYNRMIHPDDRERVLRELEHSFRTQTPFSIEYRMFRRDGRMIWVNDISSSSVDQDGNPLYYQGFNFDVTARKEIEEKIAQRHAIDDLISKISNRFLTTTPDTFEESIFSTLKMMGEQMDLDRCYIRQFSADLKTSEDGFEWVREGINPRLHKFYHQPLGLHPWSDQRILRGEAVVFSSLSELPPEAELDQQEWREAGILSRAVQPLWAGERLMGMAGFQVNRYERAWSDEDILLLKTAARIFSNAFLRNEAECALKVSEDRHRAISSITSDYTYSVRRLADGSSLPDWRSGAFQVMTGYTFEECDALGGWLAIVHPDDLSVALQRDQRLLSNKPDISEYRMLRKDGGVVWLRDYGMPVWDDKEQRVVRIIGAAQDITRQKHYEEKLEELVEERTSELRHSEERYRSLIETSTDGIVLCALDGTLLYCNQRTVELFKGNHYGEMLGLNVFSIVVPEQQPQVMENARRVLEEGKFSAEYRAMNRLGELTDVEISAAVMRRPSGEPFAFMAIVRDISERKRSELRLKQYTTRLEILQKVDRAILNAQGLEELSDSVLDLVRELVPCERISISTLDLAGGVGTFRAILENGEHFPGGGTFLLETGFQMDVLLQGKPLEVPDVTALPPVTYARRWALVKQYSSFFSVPLVAQGSLTGILSLSFSQPNAFTPEQVEIVHQVGDSLATAIQQMTTYDQANRRAAQMEALLNLSARLRAVSGQAAMFDILCSQMVEYLGGEAASICLVEDAGFTQASFCGSPREAQTAFNAARQMFWHTYGQGHARLYSHMDPLLQSVPGNPQENTPEYFILLAPITTREGPYGLVSVFLSGRRSPGDEEFRVVNAMTEISANALNRASLFEALQQRAEDRTRELQAIYQIIPLVNESADLQAVMGRSLQLLLAAIRVKWGAIYLLNKEESSLEIAAQENLPSNLLPALKNLPLDTRPWQEHAGDFQPRVNSSLGLGAQVDQLMSGADIHSFITIPILSRSRPAGLLFIPVPLSRVLSPGETSLLTILANQLGVAADNIRLRNVEERAAVLRERARLSRDLHDSVAQYLYSQALFCEAALDLTHLEDRERLENCIHTIRENALQAVRDIRMLVFELGAPTVEEIGLERAIQHRLNGVEKRIGTNVHFSSNLKERLPERIESELYFICMEALNNIFKHAHASSVKVSLNVQPKQVVLFVEDNGAGFDINSVPLEGHMGLLNINQRARSLNGTLQIQSHPEKGTGVTAIIPLPSAPAPVKNKTRRNT